jgi:2-polyprenyl-6-methoxyphenol hydroxylase-like FAD-dependent oxidoreductase
MVWYHNADEKELNRILTDSTGKPHTFSLGVGKMQSEIISDQRKLAAAILPPPIADLFQKIERPFIQAITDNFAKKTIFMDGKVLLMGDAAAGLRPHTTAGGSQAAMHALLLKKVFEKDNSMNLEQWEE